MFQRCSNLFRLSILSVMTMLATAGVAQPQVTTYHYDNLRTGLNSLETQLTPANINASKFGLLFSLPVDGQVYAQPLYLPRVFVPGKGIHNVVYIATEHNSVYAFDADSNSGPNAKPLWHVNFGPSVPYWETGSEDINPEVGITGTPVIYTLKTGSPVMYVVSKVRTTDSQNNPIYTQKLHALNVATGAEQLGGPLVIAGTVPGTGDASSGGKIVFDSRIHHNRPGLLVVSTPGQGNTLYVAFASHGDNGPYHGWVFAYDADKLKPLGLMNTSPNANTDPSGYPLAAGGIWQGGGAPASDGSSIYFATGNGMFDPAAGSFGDAIVRIPNKKFSVADYFAPSNQLNLNDYDADLGSGAVMLLPSSASGTSKKNLLVQSGKEGTIYLLNTANLGKYNPTDQIVQELPYAMGGIWGAPAYFNKTVFFGPTYSSIVSFPIKDGKFTSTTPSAYTPTQYQYPGPTPSISSNGLSNGILWAISADNYGNGGPAVLHAYDASHINVELYDSSATAGRDILGGAVKFNTPVVVNGKVYVGCTNSVGVFGHGTWAATPVVTPAAGNFANSITVKVTDTTPRAQIRYTTDGSIPSETSPLYSKPLSFNSSLTFSARAFMTGGGASSVVSRNYLINPVIGNGTGLLGSYYDGIQDPAGTPTAVKVDSTIDLNWGGNSPISGVGSSNWAGMWTGQIQAMTTGTYTLTTNSDDGVRVYIDGNLVIDNYTYHAPTYNSGTVNLVAGEKHSIVIKFFQGGGGSILQLFWAAPGIPFQIVPTSQLYVPN